MRIRLLYCGVDTLEASYAGTLSEGLAERLDGAKSSAQATDRPTPFTVADQTLYVSASGQGKYAWVLTDHRMLVRVLRTTKGIPPVSIKLRAAALASYGHEALYADACAIAAGLGEIAPNTLSRIDLAADVQGMDFTDADCRNLVCAASYRATHEDGEGMTYQLGKGDAVVRIYRKDAELRAKNNLSYAKVWEHGPDYDPSAPVWRVEVQLRGSILQELNARSVPVAFGKLGALFAFGMQWCELRVPSADCTKKRWPVDPRWALLSGFWGASAPEPRIRRASQMEREDVVVSRLVGACASLGAYSGQPDLLSVLIYALPVMEKHISERGLDFEKLVSDKVARIASEEGLGF